MESPFDFLRLLIESEEDDDQTVKIKAIAFPFIESKMRSAHGRCDSLSEEVEELQKTVDLLMRYADTVEDSIAGLAWRERNDFMTLSQFLWKESQDK